MCREKIYTQLKKQIFDLLISFSLMPNVWNTSIYSLFHAQMAPQGINIWTSEVITHFRVMHFRTQNWQHTNKMGKIPTHIADRKCVQKPTKAATSRCTHKHKDNTETFTEITTGPLLSEKNKDSHRMTVGGKESDYISHIFSFLPLFVWNFFGS